MLNVTHKPNPHFLLQKDPFLDDEHLFDNGDHDCVPFLSYRRDLVDQLADPDVLNLSVFAGKPTRRWFLCALGLRLRPSLAQSRLAGA
jgi:hypothetical protein